MRRHVNQCSFLRAVAVFLFTFILFFGCSDGTEGENPAALAFADDAELRDYLVAQYAQSVLPGELSQRNSVPGAPNREEDMLAPVASKPGHSETNIQEKGVDESDVVKTDGQYIFSVGDQAVQVSRAYPPENMESVSWIPVNGRVSALYLYQQTLVVLYTASDGGPIPWEGVDPDVRLAVGMPYWMPVKARTGAMLLDVSEPETPRLIKRIEMDGRTVSSRLTGGRLHLVTQFIPEMPPLQLWYEGGKAERSEVVEANKKQLEAMAAADFLPSFGCYDADGGVTEAGRLVAVKDFIRPQEPGGATIVSIVTIPVKSPDDWGSLGFVGDVHEVYASIDSLVLLGGRYHAVGFPGSRGEITGQETVIFQFDWSERVSLKASGAVQGWILDQFSIGEHERVLRIATATGDVWSGSAETHVYCLSGHEGRLHVIGRLENLAPGERLYAARFVGGRGYLVTFVEIDPLFVLDLSDPWAPVVAGELKVPGYSTYIHPLGTDFLLTLGKDTKPSERENFAWYQGLQLSIFDVGEASSPQLLHKELIGDRGTDSLALHDHKAFTFWPEKNLLALPVDLRIHRDPPANPSDIGTPTFSGIYVYRVSPASGFTYLGRIPLKAPEFAFYWLPWMRGLFIEDYAYAIRPDLIRASPLNAIDPPFMELRQK